MTGSEFGCAWPRCRREGAVCYLGTWLCDVHWTETAERSEREALRRLAAGDEVRADQLGIENDVENNSQRSKR